MPREYDPDFDDTPPSSPKPVRYDGRYRPTRWPLRRFRSTLFLLCLGILAFYSLSRIHKFVSRPVHAPSLIYKNVEWRQFAYSQYATDSANLCNAVMVFEALDRLGSKAQRLLLYPEEMDTDISDGRDRDSQLLVKARDLYGVRLFPIPLQAVLRAGVIVENERALADSSAWDASVTKFLIFNQTQYSRIVHLDSDVTVLRHMDDLFLLPPSTVAAPRAYWDLPRKALTSRFMVVEPSETDGALLAAAVDRATDSPGGMDNAILNELYADSAAVLPHRIYALASHEFRRSDHTSFLGSSGEAWDPDRALRAASVVHFVDSPLPKPWIMWPHDLYQEIKPACEYMSGTPQESGCRNREVWTELYDGFRRRRKDICGLLSVPAPYWAPPASNNVTM